MDGNIAHVPGATPGNPPLRVLAVDDDPAEFALLEDGFASCGTTIDLLSATSAPMALAELMLMTHDGCPYLALIDVNMPLVSGFALATQLLREGVPTILMSNHVDAGRVAHAHALGALDLLTKPGDPLGYARLAADILHLVRRK